MAKIVEGLFGLSPEQVMQQQRLSDEAQAQAFAQTDAFGGIKYGMSKAGSGLIRGLSEVFGMGDPQLIKARDIESILKETQGELPSGTPPAAIYNKLYEKLSAKGYTSEALNALGQANEAAIKAEELDIQRQYYSDLAGKNRNATILGIEKEIQDSLAKATSNNKTLTSDFYKGFKPLGQLDTILTTLAEKHDLDPKELKLQAQTIFNKYSGATSSTKYGEYPLYSPSEAWTKTLNYINKNIVDKDFWLTGNELAMEEFENSFKSEILDRENMVNKQIEQIEINRGIRSPSGVEAPVNADVSADIMSLDTSTNPAVQQSSLITPQMTEYYNAAVKVKPSDPRYKDAQRVITDYESKIKQIKSNQVGQ